MSLEHTIWISGIVTALITIIALLLMRNSQLKEKVTEQSFKNLEDRMNGRFDALEKLTKAEFEVIKMYGDGTGKTMKEIAVDTFKSENTIKKQIQSAFKKLGVKKRSQLEALIRDIVREENAKR